MIEMIDLYLIGLVLIIFALGLYQLFIDPDLFLPEWLNTPSLDTLKERLMVIVIVLLPIIFLGHVSTAKNGFFYRTTWDWHRIGNDCHWISFQYCYFSQDRGKHLELTVKTK